MNILKKLHIPALVGALGSLVGLADLSARPEISAALPHFMPDQWAVACVAIGTAISAVSRAIHAGDKMEIPKR
jgi:hypothetical protein